MTYELEKLPDEAIILASLHADWNMRESLETILEEFLALLESVEEDVYFVSDLSPEAKFSMQDMVWAANLVARGGSPILKHPRIKGFLSVAPNKLTAMAGQGLSSATFGRINVHIFESLDEALMFARSAG